MVEELAMDTKKMAVSNMTRPISCFDLYSDQLPKDTSWKNARSYTLSASRATLRSDVSGKRRRKTIREYFRNNKLFLMLRRRHLFRKKARGRDLERGTILQFPDISVSFDPKLHCNALNYHDGQLVSGRLDDLIKLLIPTKDAGDERSYYPDRNFIFAFLLCVRLFTPTETVLERVYDITKENIEDNEESTTEILSMIVQLLQEWTAHFPYDFKKKNMMSHFNNICALAKSSAPDTSASVNLISTHLVHQFDELLKYMSEHNLYHIPLDEETNPLLDICSDAVLMAKQLTIMELEKLSKISPEQFIERFIAEDVTVSKLDLTKETSPLEVYVSWFNRLSLLVATEVCACPELKGRIKIINFFIEAGRQCLKLGNFNSLMAIIVGLNMNSVSRMAKTWKKCNDSSFKRLERVVSPDKNFHRYRRRLNEKLVNGCEYVIPVFSVFVKDLYVLNEGIKDRLPNELINFQKCWHISKQVNDMMILKSKCCTYNIDTVVMDYLLNTPACTEDMLYKASFDVEQPKTEFERNRYQSVRLRLNKDRPFSVA